MKVTIYILAALVVGLIAYLIVAELKKNDTTYDTSKAPVTTAGSECKKDWLCSFLAVTNGLSGLMPDNISVLPKA
jgi:hypothetical protein